MISRGQIARKLYRSCLQDVAIGRNDPIPARDGRVSGIFFGRLGVAPSIFSTPISCRNYADRPISRPKAHTGRTTNSPRRKATVKSSDAADPDTAKHEAKAVSKAKTKAKANPKAKPKANSKAKSKAKPKKVSKSHIVGRPRLTEKQLEARKATNTRLRIVELKAKALLTRPKLLPASAFAVIFAEECKGNPSVQEGAKNAAIHYKAITPEKREHYNHIANQNKAANEATHQKWIESHTPLEIAEANLARSQLRSRFSMKGLPLLRDKRLVPGRTSSYMFFTKERIASEDFKNISCQDRAKLIAKEWKKIPEADRKKYLDLATQDMERFRQEKKAVYGVDNLSSTMTPKAKAAAAA